MPGSKSSLPKTGLSSTTLFWVYASAFLLLAIAYIILHQKIHPATGYFWFDSPSGIITEAMIWGVGSFLLEGLAKTARQIAWIPDHTYPVGMFVRNSFKGLLLSWIGLLLLCLAAAGMITLDDKLDWLTTDSEKLSNVALVTAAFVFGHYPRVALEVAANWRQALQEVVSWIKAQGIQQILTKFIKLFQPHATGFAGFSIVKGILKGLFQILAQIGAWTDGTSST